MAFKDFQRRFCRTLPLTVVVFVLATLGVLFRNAAAIENFRKVDTRIIDKRCRRRLTAQAVRRGPACRMRFLISAAHPSLP
ncbi:MAG: hypothetical protein ABIF28_03430 [Pseudomonadota bacterium]